MDKRVIIVEDEDNVRETLELLLSNAGYTVKSSATGTDIFNKITEFNPDIILLDVLLGDLDGRDICREIKANPHTQNTPVIMLSGVPDVYNAISDVGANDVVSKPFDEITLLNRIERQLSNSKIQL
ncbi:MAG: response regulator [Sphingobacteriaceae bacterium]|nr:response regulator [Sphingobacteriaceae bacterium]